MSYLKAENQILRSRLPDRLSLNEREKNRLCRFAKNLGKALNERASIVHPDTTRRWISASKTKGGRRVGKPGRKRTLADIEKLILQRHAQTLWQCDFFSKKVVSKTGLRDLFVLVFLHVETRRVLITPSTYTPDEKWMIEQAEAFVRHTKSAGLRCKILMHDNDGKYSTRFLDPIKKSKVKPHRTAIRSPNTVANVERVIQTLQQEVLDEFIVFGRTHMDHLCEQFRLYYHHDRPHQGLDNELLTKPDNKKRKSKHDSSETIQLRDVRCHERLGGLLKSY